MIVPKDRKPSSKFMTHTCILYCSLLQWICDWDWEALRRFQPRGQLLGGGAVHVERVFSPLVVQTEGQGPEPWAAAAFWPTQSKSFRALRYKTLHLTQLFDFHHSISTFSETFPDWSESEFTPNLLPVIPTTKFCVHEISTFSDFSSA